MARQMSPMFLGKQIDGLWHTNICVYGNEYYFGGGVMWDKKGMTRWGPQPNRTEVIGETSVPQELFEEFLDEVRSRYTMEVSFDSVDSYYCISFISINKGWFLLFSPCHPWLISFVQYRHMTL